MKAVEVLIGMEQCCHRAYLPAAINGDRVVFVKKFDIFTK